MGPGFSSDTLRGRSGGYQKQGGTRLNITRMYSMIFLNIIALMETFFFFQLSPKQIELLC